jgi:xylose isomerase
MDTCARGLKAAAAMLEDGGLTDFVEERYAGWNPRSSSPIRLARTTGSGAT